MIDNTQELGEIEQVIRSVLTPNSYIVPQEGIELTKAILDWNNKQIEAVLDRLESQSRRADECTDDTYVVKMFRVGAERNKLKEGK